MSRGGCQKIAVAKLSRRTDKVSIIDDVKLWPMPTAEKHAQEKSRSTRGRRSLNAERNRCQLFSFCGWSSSAWKMWVFLGSTREKRKEEKEDPRGRSIL